MLRVTYNLGQSKLYGDFEPSIFVHEGNEDDYEYIPIGIFRTEQEAINKYMKYLSSIETLEELREDMNRYD